MTKLLSAVWLVYTWASVIFTTAFLVVFVNDLYWEGRRKKYGGNWIDKAPPIGAPRS